jgi:hypothetical protein
VNDTGSDRLKADLDDALHVVRQMSKRHELPDKVEWSWAHAVESNAIEIRLTFGSWNDVQLVAAYALRQGGVYPLVDTVTTLLARRLRHDLIAAGAGLYKLPT